MTYTIAKLNRTVELNDEIVMEYRKYSILRDNPFSIAVKTKFGHAPSKEEISDDELSKLCNRIMLSEMKAFCLLPDALERLAELEAATKQNKLIDITNT